MWFLVPCFLCRSPGRLRAGSAGRNLQKSLVEASQVPCRLSLWVVEFSGSCSGCAQPVPLAPPVSRIVIHDSGMPWSCSTRFLANAVVHFLEPHLQTFLTYPDLCSAAEIGRWLWERASVLWMLAHWHSFPQKLSALRRNAFCCTCRDNRFNISLIDTHSMILVQKINDITYTWIPFHDWISLEWNCHAYPSWKVFFVLPAQVWLFPLLLFSGHWGSAEFHDDVLGHLHAWRTVTVAKS